MKKSLVVGCLAIVAVAVIVSQMRTRSMPPIAASPVAETSHSDVTIGVEAFMQNVDNHRGRIRVEGVVSVISATNQTLGLIDLREFRTCGLEQCAELTLPVRWTGAMPAVGQAVRADGEVQEARGKLVFVAQNLEKTEPLPAKAQ